MWRWFSYKSGATWMCLADLFIFLVFFVIFFLATQQCMKLPETQVFSWLKVQRKTRHSRWSSFGLTLCSTLSGNRKVLKNNMNNITWKINQWSQRPNKNSDLSYLFGYGVVRSLPDFAQMRICEMSVSAAAAGRPTAQLKGPLCCCGFVVCHAGIESIDDPCCFLRRTGWGRCKPEQWLHLPEAGGDWLHGRWGPLPALDLRQHSWRWRRHTTPPPGPPILPRCPGPWGQHLQRPTLWIGRAADHPGAQRSGFRVRVGEPRTGPRLG